MLGIIISFIFGAVGGFLCGMLTWRNNAKKFADIEARAKNLGKSIEDVIRSLK
ncbi:MAG TPA: hypothetical protein PKV92_08350 [Thermodesulfovibrio thiophilus]|nr:hypothetical protein [Thermodesulfovibrio thiophilus]